MGIHTLNLQSEITRFLQRKEDRETGRKGASELILPGTRCLKPGHFPSHPKRQLIGNKDAAVSLF